MDLKKVLEEASGKMDDAIVRLLEEFKTINIGRANASLVEGIMVSYYGTSTPLKQVASIATPDAHQIVITPWDRGVLNEIESAIRSSELNLSPVNDGNAVRLNLPPMTEERRQDLTKLVAKMGEETKITLRNIRGDAWDQTQSAQKRSEITEDDLESAKKELNELVSKKNIKVDEVVKARQTEIMKV